MHATAEEVLAVMTTVSAGLPLPAKQTVQLPAPAKKYPAAQLRHPDAPVVLHVLQEESQLTEHSVAPALVLGISW